jgi:hypothetical protein
MRFQSESFQLLIRAIQSSIQALALLLIWLAIAIVFFGALMFYCEFGEYSDTTGTWMRTTTDGQNIEATPFLSIAHAFYFVVISLTTTGYGDFVPTSPAGRVIACIITVCGILMLALPISIVGGRFQEEYTHYMKEQAAEKTIKWWNAGGATITQAGHVPMLQHTTYSHMNSNGNGNGSGSGNGVHAYVQPNGQYGHVHVGSGHEPSPPLSSPSNGMSSDPTSSTATGTTGTTGTTTAPFNAEHAESIMEVMQAVVTHNEGVATAISSLQSEVQWMRLAMISLMEMQGVPIPILQETTTLNNTSENGGVGTDTLPSIQSFFLRSPPRHAASMYKDV